MVAAAAPELKIYKQANPLFTWDANLRQYRKRGRFVSVKQMAELRRDYLESEQLLSKRWTQQLFDKEITIDDWYGNMRQQLTRTSTVQYILGKGGGRNNMTQRDWGIVGSHVKKQIGFLNNFAQQISDGNFTESQVGVVSARAAMYPSASNRSFGVARGESFGTNFSDQFPVMPTVGTICLSNDRCTWELIKETENEFIFRWTLDPSVTNHCATCLERAVTFREFKIAKVRVA